MLAWMLLGTIVGSIDLSNDAAASLLLRASLICTKPRASYYVRSAYHLNLRGGCQGSAADSANEGIGRDEARGMYATSCTSPGGKKIRESLDVVRPLIRCPDEVLRGGPDICEAATEVMNTATQGTKHLDMFWQSAETFEACSEDDSLDSEDPMSKIYPAMSTLRRDLDPDNMTREEFYLSRDYTVEGYEPMPSSRIILDPTYDSPPYLPEYVPDEWQISDMKPLETLESGWKEREAEKTLVPWLLQNAAACNRSAAAPTPSALRRGWLTVTPQVA
jgi:hypothetical protein